MQTPRLIPVLLLLLAFTSSLSGQSASAQWREYTSEKGKFTIRLPGTPTEGYRPVGADSDTSLTHVTNLIIGDQAWTVAYFDLPAPPQDGEAVKKLFNQTRDRMLKMYSDKLAEEENLTVMGYPVRSFTTRPDDRHRVMCVRIYLVGPRVYEVWALARAGAQKSAEVIGYFDSFRPVPLTDEEFRKAKESDKSQATAAVPRKMRVSGGVLEQQAIKKVQPEYPAEARAAKIDGVVEVSVVVSQEGEVVEAKAFSGPDQLREAAEQAARQWKFRPMLIQGYLVRLEGVLSFQFKRK